MSKCHECKGLGEVHDPMRNRPPHMTYGGRGTWNKCYTCDGTGHLDWNGKPNYRKKSTRQKEAERLERIREKNRRRRKSACFLTTAVCEGMGLPDNCVELTTLRRFRSDILMKSEAGQHLVSEYYRGADRRVAALEAAASCDPMLWSNLFSNYIQPTVALAQEGMNQQAIAKYMLLVDFVDRLPSLEDRNHEWTAPLNRPITSASH